jgi:hypothetical protein
MTQKAQMTQIELDRAIDHVAKRLTHVEDDEALAARIVGSLPERRRGSWWLVGPAFAALATIAIVIGAGLFPHRSPNEVAPIPGTPIAIISTPTTVVASMDSEPVRTKRVEPLERVERLEPLVEKPDHEFSLPSLASVAALSMKSLSPDALPEEAALSIAPIVLSDLALDPQR